METIEGQSLLCAANFSIRMVDLLGHAAQARSDSGARLRPSWLRGLPEDRIRHFLCCLHLPARVDIRHLHGHIRQMQLVVKPSQLFSHCSGISDHTNHTLDLCKVVAGDDDRQLGVDAGFEPAGPMGSFVFA